MTDNEMTVEALYRELKRLVDEGRGKEIVYADHLPEGVDLYAGEDESIIGTVDHL